MVFGGGGAWTVHLLWTPLDRASQSRFSRSARSARKASKNCLRASEKTVGESLTGPDRQTDRQANTQTDTTENNTDLAVSNVRINQSINQSIRGCLSSRATSRLIVECIETAGSDDNVRI